MVLMNARKRKAMMASAEIAMLTVKNGELSWRAMKVCARQYRMLKRLAVMVAMLVMHPLRVLTLGRGLILGGFFCFGRACRASREEAAEKTSEAKATPILSRNCMNGSCRKLIIFRGFFVLR